MERSPDDPNDEPTQLAGYDYRGGGDHSEPIAYSDRYREPTEQQPAWSQPLDPPPTPWYLRPLALIGWGVLTALLLTALVWGMVRLVNKDTGHPAPTTTTVSSTPVPASGEPAAPNPQPVAPQVPSDDNPPPATTPEPAPSTTPTTTEPPAGTTPSTTQPPTATSSTTAAPTTTHPPATTTAAEQPPSEIVIPLPPGL